MPEKICVIDMGSNSFKRIIGSFESGRYVQESIARKTLGVGDDLARNGRISDPKLAEIEEALGDFGAECTAAGVGETLAIGTAAFRDAPNGQRAVEVAAKLGIPMEIATEARESQLAYLVGSLGRSGQAIVDNGSRSIELASQAPGEPIRFAVFNLGYRVAWTEYFAAARAPRPAIEKLRGRLIEELAEAEFMRGKQKLVGVEFEEMAEVLFPGVATEGRFLSRSELADKLEAIAVRGPDAFQALAQTPEIDRALPRLVVAVTLVEVFDYSGIELTARELGAGLIIEAGMRRATEVEP